jgi:histidinol-phosphate aminotransferase
MSFELNKIIRENIKSLKPYSSARDEFKGKADVFLDANENNFGSVGSSENYNRYPDPLQWKVKTKLSEIKKVKTENIFIGNGSDEAIDLIFRCFCEPGIDNVIITPPTYGMYEVSANINHVSLVKVNLSDDYQIKEKEILNSITPNTKAIFVCSPNNPTGNLIDSSKIEYLLKNYNGLVIVDEAYIDYVGKEIWVSQLNTYPNLIVLQTFSKAWGLANLRIGLAYASKEIIDVFNKVKPPYNVNGYSQDIALKALNNVKQKEDWVAQTINERNILVKSLKEISYINKIYPSDANFVLFKCIDANALYKLLTDKGIVTRNRSSVTLCENGIRVSVGTPLENQKLISTLKELNF